MLFELKCKDWQYNVKLITTRKRQQRMGVEWTHWEGMLTTVLN
jgi:hypothetical protein